MNERIQQYLKDYNIEFGAGLAVLFFRFVFYKNVQIAQLSPDSFGYIDFPWSGMNGRVPVYPVIIEIFQIVMRDTALIGVVLFQICISLVSVIYLCKTIRLLTDNRYLSVLVAGIYGAAPTIMRWDVLILTESLAISGSVFFIYLIVHYIKKPSEKYGGGSILAAFLLTMHKPSFLLFNVALLFFWMFRWKKKEERGILKKMLMLSIGVICCLFWYSYQIYQVYGTFAVTPQAPRHLLADCLASGIYKNFSDADLVKKIDKIFIENNASIGYATTTPVMSLFGDSIREQNVAVKQFCIECMKSSPLQYMNYTLGKIINHVNAAFNVVMYNTVVYENDFYKRILEIQTMLFTYFKIGHLYLLCFAEFLVTIYYIIRKRYLDWIHVGLAAFMLMSICFVFVGTYAEFVRSLIHILPFGVISLSLFLNYMINALGKNDKINSNV